MGFDPTVRSEVFGGTDKSWIRVRDGLDTMLSGMLDVSAFTNNHVVNGVIPSGTVLGKITATGFYGPYLAGATDGTQNMVGHLFEDFPVRSGPVGAPVTPDVSTAADGGIAVYWEGVVVQAKLPQFAGGVTAGKIDAAAITASKHLIYV